MTMAIPKTTAEAAARYLRQRANAQYDNINNVPMLIFASEDQTIKAVVETWFEVS